VVKSKSMTKLKRLSLSLDAQNRKFSSFYFLHTLNTLSLFSFTPFSVFRGVALVDSPPFELRLFLVFLVCSSFCSKYIPHLFQHLTFFISFSFTSQQLEIFHTFLYFTWYQLLSSFFIRKLSINHIIIINIACKHLTRSGTMMNMANKGMRGMKQW
jgi:hypothetical protein